MSAGTGRVRFDAAIVERNDMDRVRRVGIDWGSKTHQVCRVDREGAEQKSFAHSSGGIEGLLAFVLEGVGVDNVIVGIEVNRGPLVEALVARGVAVYAINPKKVDRMRGRESVAGAKDDRRDARVLATSLLTDLGAFHRVEIESESLVRLRETTRLSAELKEDFRRLTARLWSVILDFRPELFELSPAVDEPWIWDLVERAPRPDQVARLTRARVGALLRERRIRRFDVDRVLAVLRTSPLPLSRASIESTVEHILALLPRIRVVHNELTQAENRIKQYLDQRVADEKQSERRDATILLSLPGIGYLTAATTLTEGGKALANRDYRALRGLAGVAPVTRQSGTQRLVRMRHACRQRLRNALHCAAISAIRLDPKFSHLYKQSRQRGHSIGRAFRGVLDRFLWLAVLLLRRNQTYDIAQRTP